MKKAVWTFLTVVVFDQLSKWYVINEVMNPPKVIEVTGFFNLVMAWNKGVSFSMFDSDKAYMPWVLSAITFLIFVLVVSWIFKEKSEFNRIFLALIAGGALGNLVDRLRFGAVADFLDFHAFSYHWPAFNVADSAICIGAFLFIAYPYMKKEKDGKK